MCVNWMGCIWNMGVSLHGCVYVYTVCVSSIVGFFNNLTILECVLSIPRPHHCACSH